MVSCIGEALALLIFERPQEICCRIKMSVRPGLTYADVVKMGPRLKLVQIWHRPPLPPIVVYHY